MKLQDLKEEFFNLGIDIEGLMSESFLDLYTEFHVFSSYGTAKFLSRFRDFNADEIYLLSYKESANFNFKKVFRAFQSSEIASLWYKTNSELVKQFTDSVLAFTKDASDGQYVMFHFTSSDFFIEYFDSFEEFVIRFKEIYEN